MTRCSYFFLRFIVFAFACKTLNSYAMLTFRNNSHFYQLDLQIAIDSDEAKAQVPGNEKDMPLENHSAIEILRIKIPADEKFSIRASHNQLQHVRIATYGYERKSQIMITALNDTEIHLNNYGEGDIFVERDLKIVNATDRVLTAEVFFNCLRKGHCGQLQLDHKVHVGVPWSRQVVGKIVELHPSESILPEQQQHNIESYVKAYDFRLPLMSFTSSRGELKVSCAKDWAKDINLKFDSLLPLSGKTNSIEIRDTSIQKMLALACARHMRTGEKSPARALSDDCCKKIQQRLSREPYIVVTKQ